MQKYLTIEEVSHRLHIATGTARNRICRGDPMPPSLKVGRRRLFPEVEFETWLRQFLQSELTTRLSDPFLCGGRQK